MDIIDEQLLAYNARDLERFLAAYSSEVVIEDGEGNLLLKGLDQMRSRYRALFEASPELNCQVTSRLRIGKYVVDEEQLTGYQRSPEPVRAVVIYRVDSDKIAQVRMLR